MGTIQVDDFDPSVEFSTGWLHRIGHIGYYKESISCTSVGGSTAIISFVGELFNGIRKSLSHPTKGSRITVYGLVDDLNGEKNFTVAPTSLYKIDGGSPVAATTPLDFSLSRAHLLFQSPDLLQDSHELTIEYAGIQPVPVCLDYFLVNVTALPASSITTSLGSTPTSPSLSTTTYTTSHSSLAPSYSSPSPFSIQQSSSSSPTSGATPEVTSVLAGGKSKSVLPMAIGPIIGGTLGVLTLTCIVLILLYRRRVRSRERHPKENIAAVTAYRFATGGNIPHSSQKATAASTTSSSLGPMAPSNNLVSLPSTLPISGHPTNHPPPSYRE